MSISIVVADDHHLFRKGLISELDQYADIEVIGEAPDGDIALQLIQATPPDVLLLDLSMPRVSGMDVMLHIKKENIEVKVIIISMHDEDHTIIECIEAGAQGFISKNENGSEVYPAIRSCIQNGFYFNDKTNKIMLNRLLKKKQLSPVFSNADIKFSPKELQIISSLSREMTTQEIAAEMHYSPRTVEGIRQDLIHRVGVRNVIGLILYAVKHGYI